MNPRFSAIALALVGTLALVGCDDTEGGNGGSSSSNSQNSTNTTALTSAWNGTYAPATATDKQAGSTTVSTLEDADLQNMTTSDRQNLVTARNAYVQSLTANPGNSTAAFGLAVTSMALRMDDMNATLNSMYDRGLTVGGASPATLFRTNSLDASRKLPVLARVLSNPLNAPKVSEMQDSLRLRLLPTLDSCIVLLERSFGDSNFVVRIHPRDFDAGDSLEIDRADAGAALAATRVVRAMVNWVVSYNVDFDKNGSYTWIDSLDQVDIEAGLTLPQQRAFDHVKTLLAPGSNFATLRSSRYSVVDGIPAELRKAVAEGRKAAILAYTEVDDQSDDVIRLDADAYRMTLQVLDTAAKILSGPYTLKVPASSYTDYVYTNCNYSAGGSCTYEAVKYTRPAYSITFDATKAITLRDFKVFIPRYNWVAYANWSENGPFSLTGEDGVQRTILSFENTNGIADLKGKISWADPSFGGIYPSFKTSTDVLNKLQELDQEYTPVTGTMPTAIRLF